MFKNVVLLTGAMIGFSTNHAIATRMANLARLHHDLFKVGLLLGKSVKYKTLILYHLKVY